MYGHSPSLRASPARAARGSLALLALILGGCAGGAEEPARVVSPPSPEQVVRAWSRALNAGDNEAAARLFADGAIVAQGGLGYVLATHRDAVLFNAGLPCSGTVVDLDVEANAVTAVFSLGHRPKSRCDVPPGTLAAARFTVRGGKIVGWEQVAVPGEDDSEA